MHCLQSSSDYSNVSMPIHTLCICFWKDRYLGENPHFNQHPLFTSFWLSHPNPPLPPPLWKRAKISEGTHFLNLFPPSGQKPWTWVLSCLLPKRARKELLSGIPLDIPTPKKPQNFHTSLGIILTSWHHLSWDGTYLDVNIYSQGKMVSSDVALIFQMCRLRHRWPYVSRARDELFSTCQFLQAPDHSDWRCSWSLGHRPSTQPATPWSIDRSSMTWWKDSFGGQECSTVNLALTSLSLNFLLFTLGFPGPSGVKNPSANAGDMGSNPGSGRSPGEGRGNPLQYSGLENPTDRGVWQATQSRGSQKSCAWLSD